MASITLNGETVHLKPVALKDFQSLTGIAVQRIRKDPDRPFGEHVAQLFFEVRKQGVALEDSVCQTLLWALHDLGFSSFTLDLDASKFDVTERRDTEAGRGAAGAMGVAAIETGRAYVAALANWSARVITVNGERIRVRPQPVEELQKVAKAVDANRLVGEDLIFTIGRAIGAMLKAEKTANDPEYRSALEIASGLGIREIIIDFANNKLAIRDLNESDAAATALLQGATAKQVQQVRERITTANAKLAESRKQAGAAAGDPTGQRSGPRVVIPAVIGSRRPGRRRGG
jgi:hypothetical protein